MTNDKPVLEWNKTQLWGISLAGVSLLCVGVIAGWGIADGWDASMWGPIAGWAGAIVTFLALVFAYYQNRQTRSDLEFERKLAKERHDEVVGQSRDQLAAQQESERKNAQIEAVRSICDAGSEIGVRTFELITVGLRHTGDQALVNERRQKWIAGLNPLSLTMRLSLVGLSDSDLMETAQEAVTLLSTMVELTEPPTLGEATDWPAVSAEATKFMWRLQRLQLILVAKTQPAFHAWAIKQGNMTPEEGEPTQGGIG